MSPPALSSHDTEKVNVGLYIHGSHCEACRCCFSRIDVDQQDTTRCRCFKCGYKCLREQVDYRYRLSLKVARDGRIFGITVFGNSLKPFFGIHANELQRLVENLDRPVEQSTRLTLLVKAVEDCFIGRHFIFGIKVMEAESALWFGGPAPSSSSSKSAAQFVATQMILPKATGLGGCTVVSYYRILLQKAFQSELVSADTSRITSLPATTLLLIHDHSPTSSFSDATLSASHLLPRSLQRSRYRDCTLTPTATWQQSLGLVTSSAEQEEGCSTQECGDEDKSQVDKNITPYLAQRSCQENQKAANDLAPFFSLQHSFYDSASSEKGAGNSPSLKTWLSPSQYCQKTCSPKEKEFSTGQLTRTFTSSSLAWNYLPFSESLTEFLCEANKDFDTDRDMKQVQNVHRKEVKARNNLGNSSLISETSSCQRNAQITDRHLQALLDATNTPATNGCGSHDSASQECKNPVLFVKRNIYSLGCYQEDDTASSLSFQKEEEEQLEGDAYNCSADLFGSSVTINLETERFTMHAEAVGDGIEACSQFSKADEHHLIYENANVTQSTPDKGKLKRSKCRESLIPQDAKEFDFVPPSQSTPIVKGGVVSYSCADLYKSMTGEFRSQPVNEKSFNANLHEMESKNNSVHKLNCGNAHQALQSETESVKENFVWRTTSSRHSHKLTPKRKFLKPVEHKNSLHPLQHLRVQGEALNCMSINCKTRFIDVSECDCEDNEAIIPPTPVGKIQQSVPIRKRKLTANNNNFGSIECMLTKTENRGREEVSEGIHGSQTCDCSRDLFSDSF
ncbi:unnamed protein product [Oreochromis niloticus]|nr:unnamed protein product [Mustela putorius furo]